MKKLICDFCEEEANSLYDITVVYDVKKVNDGHTYREEKKEVCADCKAIYKHECHKVLERVYKKLKKKR